MTSTGSMTLPEIDQFIRLSSAVMLFRVLREQKESQGLPLHMKINAAKRIKDPRYKGMARTPREYVRESILNPNVYIVFNETAGEPYPEGVMPQDYGRKLTVRALETLVDFISDTQSE